MGVEFYTDEGRFSLAAKLQNQLAELYEEQMDITNAMEAYQTAGDYHEGEGSTSTANGAFLKVAGYAAELQNYDRAIEIYENVARTSISSNLLKWSCKNYFLNAGICYLAKTDVVACNRALDR